MFVVRRRGPVTAPVGELVLLAPVAGSDGRPVIGPDVISGSEGGGALVRDGRGEGFERYWKGWQEKGKRLRSHWP